MGMLEVTVRLVSPIRECKVLHKRKLKARHTVAGDLDVVTELTSLALDLDAVVEELLEGRAVKDTIASGLGVVNDELVLSSSSLSGGGLGLH